MFTKRTLSTLATLGLLFFAGPLAAAPTQPSQANGQGIEISPPVIELNANPGQTITTNIRLRNVTSGDLLVKGRADDFGAKGEDGEPEILLDETEATRYSVKFWIPNVPDLTLKSQEVKTAQIQIKVPANAEPGGHYGVVRFTGLPPDLQGTGVSLSASIGSLVLLRVSGNITEKLNTAEFYTSAKGKKHSFFEYGPITLTERLKNDGSVHVKPAGYVDIKDIFGKQVAHLPISDPARNVLPGSIRKFDQTLDKHFLFGRYTAKFSTAYGSGGKLESPTIAFWVIPYKLIAIIIIGLILFILALRYGIRRYNRYIISQARRKP